MCKKPLNPSDAIYTFQTTNRKLLHKNIYNYEVIEILAILFTFVIITSLSILVLGMTFLRAPFTLHDIYGIKPGDPDFQIYPGPNPITPKTPYDNFLFNGCLTKPFYEGNTTVTMDTKGLEELGMWYDPNRCFDEAKSMTGYTITGVETYTIPDSSGYNEKEHMKITLTKK